MQPQISIYAIISVNPALEIIEHRPRAYVNYVRINVALIAVIGRPSFDHAPQWQVIACKVNCAFGLQITTEGVALILFLFFTREYPHDE